MSLAENFWKNICLIQACTLPSLESHIYWPSCLPLWSSSSKLSEVLSPGLQSSFGLNSNLTCNSHIVLFFFKVNRAYCCCSVATSCLTLWSHGLQHARLPCPSPSPRVCLNSCPLSWWCHPTISFSVTPFSSCPQSFPASGSFQMNWLFAPAGQSIGACASASVLPMNI